MNTIHKNYEFLARKPKSNYKQLFVKDRWIAARTIYGKHIREDSPMSPAEIADDYGLPLEAVLEAIAYCETNPSEILEDAAREEAWMKAAGIGDPDQKTKQPILLSPRTINRLKQL